MQPHPASLQPTTGWAEHLQRSLAERDSGLLDALALAAVSVGLVRWWASLSAGDVCTLLVLAAAHAAMAAWRRLGPSSWARWRDLPAALLRISAAAAPVAWAITRQVLDKPPPYSGQPWDSAVYLLTLVFTSCGATGSVMALARPLRLAWHLPAQLLTMAFIYSHNGAICGTAALSHPNAQRATAATYAALSALPATLGAPLLRQHGPEGRCRAVLALAELLLGLLAPTILLAASEVALFERYARRCAKRQQQQQQAARQLGAVAGSSSAAAQQAVPLSTPQPGRLASLLYRFLGACLRLALGEPADVAAAALTATLLLAATWRGILALTPDC